MAIPAIAIDTGMRSEEAILFPIGDEEGLLKCLEEVIFTPSRRNRIFDVNDLSSLSRVENILCNFY